MDTSALKIVLDTNILLAIIGRRSPYRWLFDLLIEGKVRLCVSNEILLEYQEVLSTKASPEVGANVVNFIRTHPATVETKIYFNFNLIESDADDNKFVDCSIAADADLILTNDGHFNILKDLDFPKIVTCGLKEFETLYRDDLNGK
ncbi:MAG: putative toxin-antitoxin system toxin component, PIN family [Pyrinomonadaceae bacterium]